MTELPDLTTPITVTYCERGITLWARAETGVTQIDLPVDSAHTLPSQLQRAIDDRDALLTRDYWSNDDD
ncbi:MAG: hypothetical protein ACM4D3_02510 [Candidatus Sericytochromatia bacterium]